MSSLSVAIRPARPEDMDRVLHVLTTAAEWARHRGIERWWPSPFPENQIRPALHRGELYVAELSGEIVGTFILRWDDPSDWGVQPPIAGYLHALAVRKDRPLSGVGRELIAWAVQKTRAEGRHKLRLGCLETNSALVSHYRSIGFVPLRVVPSRVAGEDRGTLLMEMEIR